MRTSLRVALASIVLVVGCGPKAAPPAPAGPAGLREMKMTNCPSAVVGAATAVREVEGGVVLDITATDPAAAAEIFARAERHGAMGEPANTEPMHTSQHRGPGTLGHCPVIHVGTTVAVVQIDGGARVTVTANDPGAVPALQRDTRTRLAWFDPAR